MTKKSPEPAQETPPISPRLAKRIIPTDGPERIHKTLADLVIPINDVIHYGKNPRKGDVEVIRESLLINGQYKPLQLRVGTNEILVGNHTMKAARQLGWRKMAMTFIDVDDDEAARIVLVDNASHDRGPGYDDDLLAELVRDLPNTEGTGLDQDQIDKLLGNDTELEGDPSDSGHEEDYRSRYEVVVECDGEEQQRRVYEQLSKEGLSCRVLSL